jgi:hypothetical protein
MKSIFIAAVPVLIFGSINTANANCVGPVVQGRCLSGTYVQGYDSDNGYKGSSGKTYDYNLNNPVDRNRYSVDIDAQRRDQQSGTYSTDRSRDRSRGQYGGGYRDD